MTTLDPFMDRLPAKGFSGRERAVGFSGGEKFGYADDTPYSPLQRQKITTARTRQSTTPVPASSPKAPSESKILNPHSATRRPADDDVVIGFYAGVVVANLDWSQCPAVESIPL